MKAINCMARCMAFAAAIVAAVFCAKVGAFALACGDAWLAAAGWLGMIWFGAFAVMLAVGAGRGQGKGEAI